MLSRGIYGLSTSKTTQTGHSVGLHNSHNIPCSSGVAASKGGADVVVEFLVENGLSANLAGMLRAVGITDRVRMRMLGTLPDTELDRLDKQLSEHGIDFVAMVLVREGLRRCARAGIQ
ncbi:hypothetical protein C8Q70DRAFT_188670 [Cubamyces menziesii]|nr:hypothetical protein C8Q70DRAFT_188670 [Cubamyces menziesii]